MQSRSKRKVDMTKRRHAIQKNLKLSLLGTSKTITHGSSEVSQVENIFPVHVAEGPFGFGMFKGMFP